MSARVIGEAPLVTGSITLRVDNGRWVAEYSSARVRELMGTSVMPTAFAGSVSGDEVKALVEARHEGVKVEVVS